MTGRKKNLEVSKDFWKGLRRLKQRYDAPMIDIADSIFDTSDLRILDEIYANRTKKPKKKNCGRIYKGKKTRKSQ